MGSSPTRIPTFIPCIARRILKHWTTRQALNPSSCSPTSSQSLSRRRPFFLTLLRNLFLSPPSSPARDICLKQNNNGRIKKGMTLRRQGCLAFYSTCSWGKEREGTKALPTTLPQLSAPITSIKPAVEGQKVWWGGSSVPTNRPFQACLPARE